MDSWNGRDDLAAFLLDYFCGATGMPKTERIVMPDGATTTAQEAMRVFAGLFTLWVRREGRRADALRAAAAEYPGGADLAWFAQRLAMRTASDLAVMGHTHTPVGGLTVSPVNYVNSGYMCVSAPDAAAGTELTFTQVDLERATAQVLAVVGTAGGFARRARPTAPVMPSAILPGAQDYSCYARIENRSDRPLRLVRSRQGAGVLLGRPAAGADRAARARGHLAARTRRGTEGSAGSFTYTDGTRTLDFVFRCPTGLSRNSSAHRCPSYQTKDGRGAWRTGGVEGSGHPRAGALLRRAPVGPARRGPARANGRAAPPRRPAGLRRSRPTSWRRARSSTRPQPELARRRDVRRAPDLERRQTAARPRDRAVAHAARRHSSSSARPTISSVPTSRAITVGGTKYDFVWIQPNLAPESPPQRRRHGLPPGRGGGDVHARHLQRRRRSTTTAAAAAATTTTPRCSWSASSTRRTRAPSGGWEDSSCSTARAGAPVGAQRLQRLPVRPRAFLRALNTPPGATRSGRASPGSACTQEPRACGHPTDATNIQRLVAAGWDQPQGIARPVRVPDSRPGAPAHPGPRARLPRHRPEHQRCGPVLAATWARTRCAPWSDDARPRIPGETHAATSSRPGCWTWSTSPSSEDFLGGLVAETARNAGRPIPADRHGRSSPSSGRTAERTLPTLTVALGTRAGRPRPPRRRRRPASSASSPKG